MSKSASFLGNIEGDAIVDDAIVEGKIKEGNMKG